jgi:hypothetical protein
MKNFPNKQKQKEFVASRHTLQESTEEFIQAETNTMVFFFLF